MKLLTLLDEAQYPETTFVWEKKKCKSSFSPLATCRFLNPDEMIVFLTKEAEQSIYSEFQSGLPDGLPVKLKRIPAGSSNEELWEIAQTINRAVRDNEEIALDITHGPLSFPLIALIVTIFMRVGRAVDIRAILYGVYGVDRDVDPGVTPIFDLGQMLTWLEWFVATDRFVNAGDSADLTELVKEYRRTLTQRARGDQEALKGLGSLGKLAGVLENISQSLHMIRPYQVMTHIADLEPRLDEAMPILDNRDNPLPTPVLLERVKSAYLDMANREPEASTNVIQTLKIERRLINWYADRERWVEAITLAREWLVSWTMVQFKLTELTDRTPRQRIESVLGAEAHDYKMKKKIKQPYQPLFLGDLPSLEDVLALWLDLVEVRNDINHAGKRPRPSSPKSLVARSDKCIKMINQLPLAFK